MPEHTIPTQLGQIAVRTEGDHQGEPVVFMHGVLLARTLWADVGPDLTGCRHVYIDMPAHGRSSNVGRDWTLDECADILIHMLDAFDVHSCVAIGQSWGSMTALRAAHARPERFSALGLFNMPFKATTGRSRLGFQFQKQLTVFQRFYAKQAARALYTEGTLNARPELLTEMQDRLAGRPAKELARVIDAVILNAEDAAHLIAGLTAPAIAVVGEQDYVGTPPGIETVRVPGGHISPHEAPAETAAVIKRVLALAQR
ncbi:MAG: alpha/beta hydrolase [Bacteroidota bacterium]